MQITEWGFTYLFKMNNLKWQHILEVWASTEVNLGKILMTKFHMSRMSHLTEGKEIHFPPKSNATVINNPTEAQLPKMEMKI